MSLSKWRNPSLLDKIGAQEAAEKERERVEKSELKEKKIIKKESAKKAKK